MILSKYGTREWLAATVVAAVAIGISVWQQWWLLGAAAGLAWLAVLAFFRDPPRRRGEDRDRGAMLSPADGKVTAVERVDDHAAVGGAAVVIRIFLSVLDVHVNRAPADGEVITVDHRPGRHHDARSARSATTNECNLITLRLSSGQTIGVRQIAGKVARRIVCDLHPGDCVRQGQRFGMIKFGSGTELILPRPESVAVHVGVGDKVTGGITELATVRTADLSS